MKDPLQALAAEETAAEARQWPYGADFEPSPMLGEAMAEIEADGHGARPRGGWVTVAELADDEHREMAIEMAEAAPGRREGEKWRYRAIVTRNPPETIVEARGEWPWQAERFRVIHDRVRGEVTAEYRMTSL